MTSLRSDTPAGRLRAHRADTIPRPELSPTAIEHLRMMLRTRSWTLTEWLSAAVDSEYLAPAVLVPDLMDAAVTHLEHRESLLYLAGPRGQYLAAHNPDWAHLRRVGSRRDELWLSADTNDRMAWFDYIRTVDPELAGEELDIAWDTADTASRLEFLDHLDIGLGEHDHGLLERALDDQSVTVRERAIQLLRQLPGSPFALRMRDRAQAWIRLETKPLRPRLAVRLPGSLDEHALRDGIEDVHYKNKGIRRWWLRQVVTASPLGLWESMTGSPRAALAIPVETQWRDVIMESWTAATVLQQNTAWASAFLDRDGRNTDRRIVAIADPRERVDYIVAGHADNYLLGVDGIALLDGIDRPWPLPIAEKLVAALESEAQLHAATGEDLGIHSRHSHYSTLRSAQARFPFDATALLLEAASRSGDPGWQRAFTESAVNIEQRRIRLAALHHR
ncbi:hypothetical protein ABH922_001043 [Rhodococcus sp. 27YEA15]|uniref:DUF5691 domain-containing protein n=1 Tax=Rhodococcus sp. 27YEA15 TaxID=3156259 RepID=UPI003C7B6E2B